MDELDRLIHILNGEEYHELLKNMYLAHKNSLNAKWQNIEDDTMVSYLKAYCVAMYMDIKDERQKELFIVSITLGYALLAICPAFIGQLNTAAAKMAELINTEVLDDLKELSKYSNHPIYKELSKSNKVIANIVKEQHRYLTIEEIKNGKYLKNGCNPTGYKITGKEIEMLDRAEKFKKLNVLAHLLYDEREIVKYKSDYNINNESEMLKKFLMPTHANNPEYDIIFKDGTIVNYFMGDIRIRPYKFQDVLTYTKLFYASHYEKMKEFFNVKENDISIDIAKQMVKSSFLNVIEMFYCLEDVYTKKMIDNSKEKVLKMKKLVEDYNL